MEIIIGTHRTLTVGERHVGFYHGDWKNQPFVVARPATEQEWRDYIAVYWPEYDPTPFLTGKRADGPVNFYAILTD